MHFSYGSWSFERMVNDELSSFSPEEIEKRIVTQEMINELPSVVQRWLKRSNISGREFIQNGSSKANR